jgi:hypothetical protein
VKNYKQTAVPVVDHLPGFLELLGLASEQIASDVSNFRDAVSVALSFTVAADREQLLLWP